ncbi:MAG TPA: CheR family methyltransferase [Candidatus Didemnitutus sp.]|nr:CheR family methyltransferase [Candidatus Didemnitutus sp.]
MSELGNSPAPAVISLQDPVPQLLRDLVHERLGLFFDADRLDLMIEKIEPRARALNCPSYLDYYYILKYDEKGADEWRRLMDAFSVQETYFWREFDQIRVLIDRVVPQWFARHSRPLRIWSAACASGEEPYTIAMALRDSMWSFHPVEIIASDSSELALERARSGRFRERSFRSLPIEVRERYFRRDGDERVLDPAITSAVKFHWANLMDLAAFAETATIDVIFCRNVFIYFSPASIRRVTDAFAERLLPGHTLFIGASESLLKLTNQFDLENINGAFAYVRNSR